MIKFLAAPALVILEYAFHQFLPHPWLLFDPLLALVLIFTFFHYLETKPFVCYALWCGFWQDLTAMSGFGVFMISYLACAFAAAFLSRIIYRPNRLFIYPLVFLGQILNNHIAFFLALFSSGRMMPYSFLFLGRTFLEACGTALLAYPVSLFLKKCAPESTP
ncbi:MAG: hypothetical protein WC732_02300 [Candidatus Omnitrophota bacterium]